MYPWHHRRSHLPVYRNHFRSGVRWIWTKTKCVFLSREPFRHVPIFSMGMSTGSSVIRCRPDGRLSRSSWICFTFHSGTFPYNKSPEYTSEQTLRRVLFRYPEEIPRYCADCILPASKVGNLKLCK